jgi:hypothetical protein
MALSVFFGGLGAVALLPDLAIQGDNGIDHSGVPLGGGAVGLMAGGALILLLGVALNGRRAADGTWFWTGRHTFFGFPVERVGRGTVIAGVVLLPVAAVNFLPPVVVWILVIGWPALLLTLRTLRSRRTRGPAVTRR